MMEAMRGARGLTLLGVCAMVAVSCGPGDDPDAAESWPPRFDAFDFGTSSLVLFPGTCRVVDFTMRTSPPTPLDAVELVIEEGSTGIETLREFGQDEGSPEANAMWRVCAREGEPAPGRMVVRFREHPDYYAELPITVRTSQSDLEGERPALRLPLPGAASFATDVRWDEARGQIEAVSDSGEVVIFEDTTLQVVKSYELEPGQLSLYGEGRVMRVDSQRSLAYHVDLASAKVLSSFGYESFTPFESVGGPLLDAAGRPGLVAQAGLGGIGCYVAALDTRKGQLHEIVVNGMTTNGESMIPRVSVSPDGFRVAWTGVCASQNFAGIHDVRLGQTCNLPVYSWTGTGVRPVFSPDSNWLLDSPGRGDFDLSVYNVAACARRAKLDKRSTNPAVLRGAAIASGGDRVALVRNGLELFEVPQGSNQDLVPLELGDGSYAHALYPEREPRTFSDEEHAVLPTLVFSSDGQRLAGVNSASARVFDLQAQTYVETPRFDAEKVSAGPGYVRVGVEEGSASGDVIYQVGMEVSLAAVLEPGDVFLGFDAAPYLYFERAGSYYRQMLPAGEPELLGEEAPSFEPFDDANSALRVEVGERAIEVWR
ncbi:hypothetical protein FRC98_00955 [Lujinxingia vulgaris]|uniref:Uncharacterized protein n=1 Tax=Lujinxingia vulgaris TaxID=2600176 RepID=A0A5C6XN23_9DELT|nr:hypothetical protein [Lujinxingia vulgaris]TXD39002.1 hypothetical protein FRC98_00955 [Lujinxingia vulgaris]